MSKPVVVYGQPLKNDSNLKKAQSERMQLILTKGTLDEFRCGSCGALLFKGLHLEKSMIEVKCRSCGALLVSDGLSMV